MAYTAPPPLPSMETRPDTFDADVEALFNWIPVAVSEVDGARNQALQAAEAGASGYRFTFDSATAAADPTSGKIRFNNANLGLATAAYASATAVTGGAVGALLDTFDDSTNPQKGLVRVVKSDDPTKWAVFYLSAVTTPAAGYRTLSLSYVAASSSAPFGAGNALSLQYAPIGDKGDKGDQGTPGSTLVPTIHVRDQKPSNTLGGTLLNNSWQKRTLNTVMTNTITGSSLASDRVTLPAGTYEIDASVPFRFGYGTRARLYNVTDATATIEGTNTYIADSQTFSFVKGRFIINATKVFELQYFSNQNTNDSRQGGDAVGTGGPEVYSEAIFRKVA